MNIAPYIKAKFNVLLVVTHEEERVVADLEHSYPKLAIVPWTLSKGEGEKGTSGKPEAILAKIRECNRPTIFVLKDYQPFLKLPAICRGIRDLSTRDLVSKSVWVVITSPRRDLPDELYDAVTIIDYDLPDREYLSGIVRNAARGYELDLIEDDVEKLSDALSGLTEMQASNALALSHAKTKALDLEAVLEEKARAISQDGTVETVGTDTTLDDVAGYNELTGWLRKRRSAFSQEARDFGLPTPKGALLIGVPGAGKSLTCKGLARSWGLPLMKCDVGSLFGGIVGESEANVRKMIKTVEAVAPCVLWLDEVDKGFSTSTGQSSGDSGTSARVLATFITWLQEKDVPVFVIATANRPEALPAEFLRRGRWDEVWALDLPNPEGRKSIFDVHLERRMEDTSTIDTERLVEASEGFTGAEIEGCVVEGLYAAFEDGKRGMTTEDILSACGKTVPLSSAADNEIDQMRSWAKGRARNAAGEEKVVSEEGNRFAAIN